MVNSIVNPFSNRASLFSKERAFRLYLSLIFEYGRDPIDAAKEASFRYSLPILKSYKPPKYEALKQLLHADTPFFVSRAGKFQEELNEMANSFKNGGKLYSSTTFFRTDGTLVDTMVYGKKQLGIIPRWRTKHSGVPIDCIFDPKFGIDGRHIGYFVHVTGQVTILTASRVMTRLIVDDIHLIN